MVSLTTPDLLKTLFRQIAQFMRRILVITARYDFPIPGNYAGAPHAEARVVLTVLYGKLVDGWTSVCESVTL